MKSDDGQVEDDDSKKIGRFAVEVTKVSLHMSCKCGYKTLLVKEHSGQ